ncbi:hypothetical protein LY78DRAFT_338809 [Colletotrichum sublineola]|nr:hypothetical protein LY78DRAFT_338809 [Colletotrichum sublineola]
MRAELLASGSPRWFSSRQTLNRNWRRRLQIWRVLVCDLAAVISYLSIGRALQRMFGL